MKKMYQVQWEYKHSDGGGEGKPMFNSYNDAYQHVLELNKLYPFMNHWVHEVIIDEN